MEDHGYRRLKVVGRGAFGRAVVAEGCDGQRYVVKEIPINELPPQERQSALNEARVLRCLHHPNIVRYVDSFEAQGTLHIVMEYADCGDLSAYLKARQGQPLPEDAILRYFVQICMALKHVHGLKILHRDLKSQNVFLSANGELIKLGDFGIATVLRTSIGLARTQCGTPYYFSPEICMNRPYNNKSDLWSLGCLLYEMMVLQVPFQAGNMKQLMRNICDGRYQPVPTHYSRSLRTLVEQLLSRDPQQRPALDRILALDFIQTHLQTICDDFKTQYLGGINMVVADPLPVPAPQPPLEVPPLPPSSPEPLQRPVGSKPPQPKPAVPRRSSREEIGQGRGGFGPAGVPGRKGRGGRGGAAGNDRAPVRRVRDEGVGQRRIEEEDRKRHLKEQREAEEQAKREEEQRRKDAEEERIREIEEERLREQQRLEEEKASWQKEMERRERILRAKERELDRREEHLKVAEKHAEIQQKKAEKQVDKVAERQKAVALPVPTVEVSGAVVDEQRGPRGQKIQRGRAPGIPKPPNSNPSPHAGPALVLKGNRAGGAAPQADVEKSVEREESEQEVLHLDEGGGVPAGAGLNLRQWHKPSSAASILKLEKAIERGNWHNQRVDALGLRNVKKRRASEGEDGGEGEDPPTPPARVESPPKQRNVLGLGSPAVGRPRRSNPPVAPGQVRKDYQKMAQNAANILRRRPPGQAVSPPAIGAGPGNPRGGGGDHHPPHRPPEGEVFGETPEQHDKVIMALKMFLQEVGVDVNDLMANNKASPAIAAMGVPPQAGITPPGGGGPKEVVDEDPAGPPRGPTGGPRPRRNSSRRAKPAQQMRRRPTSAERPAVGVRTPGAGVPKPKNRLSRPLEAVAVA